MSLSFPKKILFTCIVLVLAFVLMEAAVWSEPSPSGDQALGVAS
jgi:hypothetical protein